MCISLMLKRKTKILHKLTTKTINKHFSMHLRPFPLYLTLDCANYANCLSLFSLMNKFIPYLTLLHMIQHITFWKYEVPEVSHKYKALMLSDHTKFTVKKIILNRDGLIVCWEILLLLSLIKYD